MASVRADVTSRNRGWEIVARVDCGTIQAEAKTHCSLVAGEMKSARHSSAGIDVNGIMQGGMHKSMSVDSVDR